MALSKKIVTKVNEKIQNDPLKKKCLIDVLSAVEDSRQGKRVLTSYLNKLHR